MKALGDKENRDLLKEALPWLTITLLELKERELTFANFGKEDLAKKLKNGAINPMQSLITKIQGRLE